MGTADDLGRAYLFTSAGSFFGNPVKGKFRRFRAFVALSGLRGSLLHSVSRIVRKIPGNRCCIARKVHNDFHEGFPACQGESEDRPHNSGRKRHLSLAGCPRMVLHGAKRKTNVPLSCLHRTAGGSGNEEIEALPDLRPLWRSGLRTRACRDRRIQPSASSAPVTAAFCRGSKRWNNAIG